MTDCRQASIGTVAMKCITGQRAKSSGSTSEPSPPVPSGARVGAHRLSGVALACLAFFSIGCAGNNQKARWASQEVGCPAEEISTTEIRGQDGAVSYYATCGDGSSYECLTLRDGLGRSSTSCDKMARATEEQRPGHLAPTPMEALLAREMGLPVSQQVAAADGRWVVSAPSVGAPVARALENNVTQVQFGLSSELSAECFFYQGALNAGAAVSAMLAEFSKNADLVGIEAYRVAEVGGYPIALFDTMYHYEKDGRPLMGSVKIGVSPRFDTPVLCVMDEPGYRKTFALFMQRLLRGLKTRDQPPEPRLSEVWRYEVDSHPVGFEMTRLVDTADGTLADLTLSALFLPVSPGELSIRDSTTLHFIDAAGPVRGEYLILENGGVHSQVNLRRGRGRNYTSQGTVQGKPFELSFVASEKLASSAVLYAHMAKTAGEGGGGEWLQYVPELDPAEPLKLRAELDPSGKTFEFSLAGVSYGGQRGKSGLPTRMRVPLGAQAVDVVLIDRVGAP